MLRRHPRTNESIRSLRYRGSNRSISLRGIALVILFVTAIFLSWKEFWFWSGFGNQIERPASLLTFMDGSEVNVLLEGGGAQRAEPALSMYPNDHIQTQSSYALLTFFDETHIGIGKDTDLLIKESIRGSESSVIETKLMKGTIWIQTPKSLDFEGNIMRRVLMVDFSLDIPPGTKAVIGDRSIVVFSAEGNGIRLEKKGGDSSFFIGEGQKWELPEKSTEYPNDLYTFRSPLGVLPSDPLALASMSLIASTMGQNQNQKNNPQPIFQEDILIVLTPQANQLIQGTTVEVTGNVGKGVESVRVNGYRTDLESDKTFRQELSLSNEEEMTIRIEALDEKGISIMETQRRVRRDISPPKAPVIIYPSASGTIYQTQSRELEIRGRAFQETLGIVVNDYRLQLFKPGDREWSYLASIELGNYTWGTNVYKVKAIDESGNESAEARITILLEEGKEGVVQEEDNEPIKIVESVNIQEENRFDSPVFDGKPLMPGSIRIVGPTNGEPFNATGSEFSIYGSVPDETFSVWINGYRLRLYEPKQPIFKYIASYDLGTMKRGENIYTIVIRNRSGEILDTLEYVVAYRKQ